MIERSRILILYDHYLPAWKAGGPIRSLEQLVNQMSDEYYFYVLTSAFDYKEKNILTDIQTDQWTNWFDKAKVYYLSNRRPSVSELVRIYNSIKPDYIIINGLFSPVFNIKALKAANRYISFNIHSKIFLSPRGMLHPGALSQKKFKKKLFLCLATMIGLYKYVEWHATDEKEVHYIRSSFRNTKIHIAGNFSKISDPLDSPPKIKGELIMGTLALISPMKNHLEILNALKSVHCKIIWHIFGPVKDLAYWDQCNESISDLPSNIQVVYHGAVSPREIRSALEKIQTFVLPSKSENFGHAIVEALSAGRPVITTNTTPFTDLDPKKAGRTLSLNDLPHQLIQAIHDFAEMDQETFSQYQNNAIQYAHRFINVEKLKSQYRIMFSAA